MVAATTSVSDYTALLNGNRWNGMMDTAGTPVVLSYAFLENYEVPSPDQYDPFGGVTGYFSFSEEQKTSFRLALDRIEAVSGVRFVEVDDPAYASISVMNSTGAQEAGWATIGGAWGDYSINGYLVMNDLTGDYAPGTPEFEVMLHELGHAMGFKHPFDGDPTLEPALDTTDHTVMSYTRAGTVKSDFQHLDVDALRFLYGTAMPADVTWSWSDTDGALQMSGSTGDDTLIGIDAPSIIHGESGNDTLWGRDAPDTLFGDDGNDTLDGGDGDDLLVGGTGNDVLNGNWGDDTLEGGPGDDTLNGFWGTDTAFYAQDVAGVTVTLDIADDGTPSGTATGADIGNDTLVDIENVVGGYGNDTLIGNGYSNVLEGGAGDDILDGGWNDDTASFAGAVQGVTVVLTDPASEPDGIAGGSASGADTGTDTLRNIENVIGGAGDDSITGNDRDNTFEGGHGNDILNGGGGIDTAIFTSALSPLTVDLAAGTASGAETGNDTLTGIENIIAGGGADRITGDAADNLLVGGNDDDVIYGGEGTDELYGDDPVFAEEGLMAEGMTAANLPSSGRGHDILHGGTGDDQLFGGLLGDWLFGESGNDTLHGEDGWDVMYGGAARDYLDGGAGRDNMHGGAGNDTLYGSGGNDTMRGDDGWDFLDGGFGDDRMWGGNLGDRMYGGDGNDFLYGDTGWDFLDGGAGRDHLNGNAGNDTVHGGDGNDSLYGEDGDDVLHGDNGWDVMFGGTGNDTMYGGLLGDLLRGEAGDDALHGESGWDLLDGGAGNDLLSGGSGNDIFVFSDGFGSDTITDFASGLDRIDLSGVSGITDWNDLTASHLTTGANCAVIIVDGANSIELSGITSTDQIQAMDFIF